MQERQYQVACDYAIHALESNPDNRALLLARARAELALGYAPMAARLARRALQQDPNNIEASGVFAQAAVSGDDRSILEEARKLTDNAVRRDPANERLLFLRGQVLTALKQTEKAIPELEAYCQTKPGAGSIAALVTLADLYRLAGDADRSKQWIDQAQRVDPNSRVVLHARLLWLAWQKQLDELKTAVSTCLSAKEQDINMLLGTASVLAASDSVEVKQQGVRLFERAAALSPTSIDVQLSLASTLYQAGDVDRAEKLYEALLKQYPDDKRILNDLAWILQEHDHSYDAALELASRGLKLAPDDLNLLDTRGTILANLPDRLADAKIDFGKLVEQSPADTARKAKALLQLGRVCAKLKDLPQAKQHLEEALKIDKKINAFTPAERAEIAEITSKSGI
jgi:tetratricopeptide (TPR) repeat protein